MGLRSASTMLAPVFLLTLFVAVLPGCAAKGPRSVYRQWSTQTEFATGATNGVKVVADGNGALVLDPAKLQTGTDTTTTSIFGPAMYNGGAYQFGTYTTPEQPVEPKFDWAVASWNATTPPGTWVQVEVQAKVKGTWTKWYNMGVWAADLATVTRHSVEKQNDGVGAVETDTLILSDLATAFRSQVTLFTADAAVSPTVNMVGLVTCNRTIKPTPPAADQTVWGTVLDVPQRSQMDYPPEGSGWCSPTSMSMVMEYWANKVQRPDLNQTVPTVAGECFDRIYGGTGNWSFNAAAAGAYGLEASVRRFDGMAQAEQWIKAGVPVIVSIQFGTGELANAPISSTGGHLITIVGFDAKGNPVCNDPAASLKDGQVVRVTYDRAQLEAAWLGHTGVVYLAYPAGHAVPDATAK